MKVDNPTPEVIELAREQQRLQHALQTGIAMKMSMMLTRETQEKHLRVGVDTCLCSHAGLCALLIERGMITHEELLQMENEYLKRDVTRAESELSNVLGRSVTLV